MCTQNAKKVRQSRGANSGSITDKNASSDNGARVGFFVRSSYMILLAQSCAQLFKLGTTRLDIMTSIPFGSEVGTDPVGARDTIFHSNLARAQSDLPSLLFAIVSSLGLYLSLLRIDVRKTGATKKAKGNAGVTAFFVLFDALAILWALQGPEEDRDERQESFAPLWFAVHLVASAIIHFDCRKLVPASRNQNMATVLAIVLFCASVLQVRMANMLSGTTTSEVSWDLAVSYRKALISMTWGVAGVAGLFGCVGGLATLLSDAENPVNKVASSIKDASLLNVAIIVNGAIVPFVFDWLLFEKNGLDPHHPDTFWAIGRQSIHTAVLMAAIIVVQRWLAALADPEPPKEAEKGEVKADESKDVKVE